MDSGKSPIPLALEFLIVIGLTYGLLVFGQLEFAFHPHKPEDEFTNTRLLALVIFELLAGGLALMIPRFNGWRVSKQNVDFTITTVVHGLLLYVASMFAVYLLYDLAVFAGGFDRAQPAPPAPFALSLPVVLPVSLVNFLFEEGILLAYVIHSLLDFVALMRLA